MLLDTRRDVPARNQPTNTFVALRPPWAVAEQFYRQGSEVCARAKIAGSRRPFFILHMTMLPIVGALGRLPDLLLERIDAAVSMVRFPAFEIVLDEALSFESRKDSVPFVLEGSELTDVFALRLAARDALHVKGLNVPVRQAFSPHMTLAYARRRSPRIRVAPFSWKACEFQLIESWVGETKYIELARWMLRDDVGPDLDSSARPVLPRAN
jgi:RNA 2',3'-cyclic 3'-phosphodiesterase